MRGTATAEGVGEAPCRHSRRLLGRRRNDVARGPNLTIAIEFTGCSLRPTTGPDAPRCSAKPVEPRRCLVDIREAPPRNGEAFDHRTASMQMQWTGMKITRRLFAVAMVVTLMCPALDPAAAAEPIYPRGIRVGLAPIDGSCRRHKTFVGFETADHGVKVLLTELPAAAYRRGRRPPSRPRPTGPAASSRESIETAAGMAYYTIETAQGWRRPAVRRYSMIAAGGALLRLCRRAGAGGRQQDLYRTMPCGKMFATVAVRKEVPVDEQLALMPFKIGRTQRLQEWCARWRPAPPSCSPTRRGDQAARSRRRSWCWA